MSVDEAIAATVRLVVREEMRAVMRETLAEVKPASVYLSVTKAADIADVDPETIRRWLSKGLLPDHRAEPTSHSRIRRDELDQLLAAKPKAADGTGDSAEAVAAAILRQRGG